MARIISKVVIVHLLLVMFVFILAYVLLGLVTGYEPAAEAFFILSFVLLFFTIAQALFEIGLKKMLVFAITTVIIGFGFEILGTSSGLPFGGYYYTNFLGSKVLNVPVVVPLIWFVITFIVCSQSCFEFPLSTRKIEGVGERKSLRWILGAVALASFGAVSWDLLVDPMFTSYGYWVWEKPPNFVPSLSGVPATNFLGWFVVSFLMIGINYFLFSRKSSPRIKKQSNVIDSRIVYALLLMDGAFANLKLGHYGVIVIGVAAMTIFLFVSFVVSSSEKSRALGYQKIKNKPLGESN